MPQISGDAVTLVKLLFIKVSGHTLSTKLSSDIGGLCNIPAAFPKGNQSFCCCSFCSGAKCEMDKQRLFMMYGACCGSCKC